MINKVISVGLNNNTKYTVNNKSKNMEKSVSFTSKTFVHRGTGILKGANTQKTNKYSLGNLRDLFKNRKYSHANVESFSKIKGERSMVNGKQVIIQSNSDVVRIYTSNDGKTLHSISECDPVSGNCNKKTFFFRPDGTEEKSVLKYDSKTKRVVKETIFQPDGKTISYICESSPKTGYPTKELTYQKDGKTPLIIKEYDPLTTNRKTCIRYREGSKIPLFEIKYNENDKKILKIIFDENGIIEKEINYNPKTGEVIDIE